MNKFLFASLAVLCACLTSCSKQELEIPDTYEHEVSLRTSEVLTVNFTDASGNNQSISCEETRLTFINSTSVEIFIKYSDGSTLTTTGDDITVLPISGELSVSTSPTSSFTTTDLDVEACRNDCCYAYDNGNTIGNALEFTIEEEAGGF